jgi:hypothetical protein
MSDFGDIDFEALRRAAAFGESLSRSGDLARIAAEAQAAQRSMASMFQDSALQIQDVLLRQKLETFESMGKIAERFQPRWLEEASMAARASALDKHAAGIGEMLRQIQQPSYMDRLDEIRASMIGMDLINVADIHESMGRYARLSTEALEKLEGTGIADLAQSQLNLLDAYARVHADPVSASLPFVADLHLPDMDVEVGGQILSIAAGNAPREGTEPTPDRRRADDIIERVIDLLGGVSDLLAIKMRSAYEAFESGRPRATAHALLDLREIFKTLVLHYAPPKEVLAWAREKNEPELFRDQNLKAKEASHKGCMLYIGRLDFKETILFARYLNTAADAFVSTLGFMNGQAIHDDRLMGPATLVTQDQFDAVMFQAALTFQAIVLCGNASQRLN